MAVQIVPATADHASQLAACLRQADLDELQAADGLAPLDALVGGIRHSWKTYAALAGDRVILLAGCAAMPPDPLTGVVWMLASDDLERHPRVVVRGARERVMSFFEQHDTLLNFVDNRNIKAQQWLGWLGFTVGEPQPFGVSGLPFRPFWMCKPGVLDVPRQDAINFVSQRGQPCATSPQPSLRRPQ